MKNLMEIRQRLLALPDMRLGRDLEAKYAAFLVTTRSSAQKVERAVRCPAIAADVVPGVDYSDALKRACRAASAATRLRTTLGRDAQGVSGTSVERSFTLMNEHADTAWKNCQDAWMREMEAKVRDWAPLVEVVSR